MQKSRFKSTGGLLRVVRAFAYSVQGLAAAWRHEAAFRQELALVLVLLPLALYLGETALERLLLIGALLLVLLTELLNSAIEALADAISLKEHEFLGRAKDLGSAAVFIALLLCVFTWFSVLWPN